MLKFNPISIKLLSLFTFLFFTFFGYSQTVLVKGVVVDNSGVPLIGLTVLVEGTTNGTTTDFDGNYVINIKTPNATLVFSYVGYTIQKIVVGK